MGDSEALLQAVRLINCNEPVLTITATLSIIELVHEHGKVPDF